MIDDAELLRRYAEEHSEEAFAELVRRHVQVVYAAALRQLGGDAHGAQDVVQSVFTHLARSAGKLSGHPLLVGWLFVSTRHAAAKVVRGNQRRQLREHEAHTMQEISAEPTSGVDWERLRPVLNDVLHQLSATDRELVLLRFFEQRPFDEISAALRLSEAAARKRVDRALDKLRALLATREITSTTAALGLLLANQPVVAVPAGLVTTVTAAAMASAGTAATSAVGFLQAMGKLKLAFGVAAAGLIVALGFLGYEFSSHRQAEASRALARQNYAALLARLPALEQRAQTVEQAAAQRTTNAAAGRASPAAVWDPVAEGQAFLAAHPEIRQALANESRAKLNFRWGAFHHSAGLRAAQIEQFQELLREVEPGNDAAGIDGKRLVIRWGTGMPRAEVERRLRNLLGDDGYLQFTAYAQTVPARGVTHQLASALAFTETPLTAEQSEHLIQVMTASRTRPGFDWVAVTGRTGQGFDWDAVVGKVQGVLPATLVAALEGLRAQDQVTKAMRVQLTGPLPPPSGTYVAPKTNL